MNKIHLLALAGAMMLGACSSATSAPPPPTAAPAIPPTTAPVQPTAVPPTQPPPPTATVPPPTATRPAPTATPAPVAAASGLEAVMSKMSALDTTYRFSMSMNMSGIPGVGSAELMAAQGEGQGQNSRLLMNGMAFQLMGANKGIEMITADKKSYLKGPMPLLGAPDAKWYEMKDNQQMAENPVQNFFGRDGGTAGSGFDPKSFKKAGSEKIDGVTCDIYEGDREALQRAFQNAQASGGGGQANAAQVTDGVVKMWVCEDGYVRRTTMDLKMTTAGQNVNMTMFMRMYDFGTRLDPIVPPPDAQPLQAGGPGVRNTPRP